MMRRILIYCLLAMTVLSCNDERDIGANSPDGSVSISPRIVTTDGTPLPIVDSVRITVLNANSTNAAPFYERSISWDAHGDTITGIPADAAIRVQISGVKKQADGSRAIWWSGAADGTFSGTTRMDAQSFPVPVTIGDTAAPRILSIQGDSIENMDTLIRLVWRIDETELFDAVSDRDTLHPTADSIVQSRPWTTGDTMTLSTRFRDATGNITTRTVRLVRRLRVALPIPSFESSSFTDTTRIALSCPTPNAEIEWSSDSGNSWKRYEIPLLVGSDLTLWARATHPGWTTSLIAKVHYAVRAASPTFSLPDGTDTFDLVAVKLTSVTPNAGFEISLDSGKNWSQYKDSLRIGRTVQVWARTVKSGLATSTIGKSLYKVAVAKPTFSVPTGSAFDDLLTIQIATKTPGASIETSVDGSTWTTIKDAIILGAPTTLRARAAKPAMTTSETATATYTIQAAPPTFSLPDGTDTFDLVAIKLASTTPDASFEVSLDSGENWSEYKDSLRIGKTIQVWARTIKSGLTTSAIAKISYKINSASPEFSLPEGTYDRYLRIHIFSKGVPGYLRYTLDGTLPTDLSPLYTDSIFLEQPSTTIHVRRIVPGMQPSPEVAATFKLALPLSLPSIPASTGIWHRRKLALTNVHPSARIFYSVNASFPDTLSTEYQDSIEIDGGDTLRVLTVSNAFGKIPPQEQTFIYPETWNKAIPVGYVTDTRDGTRYRTTKINGITWMAENLRHLPLAQTYCQSGNQKNCESYGVQYPWIVALDLASNCEKTSCASQIVFPRQGVCMEGWHLPSRQELQDLIAFLSASGASGSEAQKLKSRSGWDNADISSGNGDDAYGFAGFPAGGPYNDVGGDLYFWLADESSLQWGYAGYLHWASPTIQWRGDMYKTTHRLYVRCVQNAP